MKSKIIDFLKEMGVDQTKIDQFEFEDYLKGSDGDALSIAVDLYNNVFEKKVVVYRYKFTLKYIDKPLDKFTLEDAPHISVYNINCIEKSSFYKVTDPSIYEKEIKKSMINSPVREGEIQSLSSISFSIYFLEQDDFEKSLNEAKEKLLSYTVGYFNHLKLLINNYTKVFSKTF